MLYILILGERVNCGNLCSVTFGGCYCRLLYTKAPLFTRMW